MKKLSKLWGEQTKNKLFGWFLWGLLIFVFLYFGWQVKARFCKTQFNKFIEDETFATYYFTEQIEFNDIGLVVGEIKFGRCFKE